MTTLKIVGYFLVLYGLACLAIALAKPAAIWKLGKIQGFIQLLGDKGTVILFLVIGVAQPLLAAFC